MAGAKMTSAKGMQMYSTTQTLKREVVKSRTKNEYGLQTLNGITSN